MGDKTGIEWTDATWNPTTGCDRVSPGCDHCYAMTLAPRLKAMGSAHYQTDGDPTTSGPGFGFQEHPDGLDKPLRWTRARRIFVNSMSDLFHESATRQHVIDVFAVMALAQQHTFQLLTKRPAKMRSWLSSPSFQPLVRDAAYLMMLGEHPSGVKVPRAVADAYGDLSVNVTRDQRPWPLPNLWLGTSVEDQKRADLRIPPLLNTPAAVRFLSMEPLLGPVVLGRGLEGVAESFTELLDWIIVGGESGAGARPMHLQWVRSLRDECVAVETPFHFKQWGSFAPVTDDPRDGDHWVIGRGWASMESGDARGEIGTMPTQPWAPDTVGAPPGRWDAYGDVLMRPMHKKDAGREIDGRTWDEFPS